MSACVTNEHHHQDQTDGREGLTLDGAARQRRRFGKGSALSPEADTNDAVVLPFPSRVQPQQPDTKEIEESDHRATVLAFDRPAVTEVVAPKRNRGRASIGVLLPGLTLPKDLSGYRPQDVGLVTHAAIAIMAPTARALSPESIPECVLDVTGALVNGDNVNRRRVLMLTAAGHVAAYLRRFLPAAPWDLIGCEYDTGKGRTDLAWRHADTGQVFFDEIKTTNRAITRLSSLVIAQVKRQGEGGVAQFGPAFAGVRLLPFGSLHLASLVHPDRRRMPLSPTGSEPLRLAVTSDRNQQ